ncbi:MAG TPA: prephenate dehydrogenase [Chloroflexia bacterium]
MAQITIIGLGTIGSSLGLALHQYMETTEGRANAFTIVGYDPARDAQMAQKSGSVDRVASDLPSAVRESPFVIIATPTLQVREILQTIAPLLPAGATVTDTAPGKRLVLQWAAELLPPTISFVGGHPLPHRVPAPAVTRDEVEDEPPAADLFAGAPYCIMPLPNAAEAAVNQVIGFAEAVGAKPYFTDPLEHDSFEAAVHDLPVLTSFALMRVLSESPAWRDMGPLAGAAFREASRMASSDPLAVRAELVANRDNLLNWIDRYEATLQDLRELLAATDPADLEGAGSRDFGAALIAGRNARTGWLNPNAALTPAERQARDTMRQAGSGVLRSFFGGFVADRLPGNRDPEHKDRRS